MASFAPSQRQGWPYGFPGNARNYRLFNVVQELFKLETYTTLPFLNTRSNSSSRCGVPMSIH